MVLFDIAYKVFTYAVQGKSIRIGASVYTGAIECVTVLILTFV